MFEKVGEALKKLFVTAYHTVTKSLRQFIPLLLTLLLLECILFSVFFVFFNAITRQQEQVAEEYDYHVTIAGLTEAEMLTLKVDNSSVFTNDQNFKVIHVLKFESENYDPTYTVRVKLLTGNKDYGWRKWFIDDSLAANYEAMCLRYPGVFGTEKEPNTRLSIEFSPLYEEKQDLSELRATRNVTVLLLAVVSTLALTSFYRIYTDNQKFKFGIYATFGADFRRLRLNALAEMLLCVLFTILPSYYIGNLIAYGIARFEQVEYHFSVLHLGILGSVLLWMIPIVFVAVYFPLKLISAQKETMKLILAEDNASLVSSPTRSVDILRRRFPVGYEWLTVFRFRRHHLRIALTSALVCVLVISGSYLSTVYKNSLLATAENSIDYTVEFHTEVASRQELRDTFAAIEGVETVHSSYSSLLGERFSGLLYIAADDVARNAGLAKVSIQEETLYCTGEANYMAAVDGDMIDRLTERYTVTGDPYALLDSPDNVIVGSTFRGRDAFDLAPGDTVTVASPQRDADGNVVLKEGVEIDENGALSTGKQLWKKQHEMIEYDYRVFTVVAVIEDYPSGAEGIPLVMNASAYQAVTGDTPTAETLQIKLSDSLDAAARATAEEQVYSAASLLGSGRREPTCTVASNSNAFYERMKDAYCFEALILVVSCLLVIILPLHWFYSQALFFRKREREMYILHALFAPLSRLRSLFFSNSLVMLPIGVVSVGASGVILGLLYSFCNRFMPNVLKITSFATAELSLPLFMCLICFVLTFICCILSAVVPYIRCIRQLKADSRQIPLNQNATSGL